VPAFVKSGSKILSLYKHTAVMKMTNKGCQATWKMQVCFAFHSMQTLWYAWVGHRSWYTV